ncbi:MAG: RNA polymerase sigma factor [Acidobacteria bacterium]|jgi:RNA polymerase sigma-70 factor (ECF subfamily)|nr:RNA polymerase sigma factor [Acidobacteriota bacterium]
MTGDQRNPMEPPEQSDQELLRLMLEGDEAAFTALYRRRQGAIFRFALQMGGSRAMAEEVTQETFLTLIQEARRYDPARGSVAAYLYGIARNQVLRRLDSEKASAPLEPRENDQGAVAAGLAAGDDLLGSLLGREQVERVRAAVLALPARYREVVVLCDLHEIDYAEAARALDCPIGTVRSRLHRGHRMLAGKLAARPRAGFCQSRSLAALVATPQAADSDTPVEGCSGGL